MMDELSKGNMVTGMGKARGMNLSKAKQGKHMQSPQAEKR